MFLFQKGTSANNFVFQWLQTCFTQVQYLHKLLIAIFVDMKSNLCWLLLHGIAYSISSCTPIGVQAPLRVVRPTT